MSNAMNFKTVGVIGIGNIGSGLVVDLVLHGIPGFTSAAQLTPDVTQSGGSTMIDLTSSGTNLKVVLSGYTGSLSQTLFT